MKLTFDWNCFIDVDERRPQARFVERLIQLHRRGQCEVALLSASASENNRSRQFPRSASAFKNRIEATGWDDLPLLPAPAIIGLAYIGESYIVGEDFERERKAIWEAIAPNVAMDPLEHLPSGTDLTSDLFHSKQLSKWRNTHCDVISAYTHIHANRDIFVTSNTRDFQNNAEELGRLGMRGILTPQEACSAIDPEKI